jgi:hypothetical protein
MPVSMLHLLAVRYDSRERLSRTSRRPFQRRGRLAERSQHDILRGLLLHRDPGVRQLTGHVDQLEDGSFRFRSAAEFGCDRPAHGRRSIQPCCDIFAGDLARVSRYC